MPRFYNFNCPDCGKLVLFSNAGICPSCEDKRFLADTAGAVVEIAQRQTNIAAALERRCPICGAIARDVENIPGTLLYEPSGYMCPERHILAKNLTG